MQKDKTLEYDIISSWLYVDEDGQEGLLEDKECLLSELAWLRHKAHTQRLDGTERVEDVLSQLGFNIAIDDVEMVHDIVNPILLKVDRIHHTEYASHGIAAMNAYGRHAW